MPKLSESLAAFIQLLKTGDPDFDIPAHNAPELLDRWSISMETQVNVISALGHPIEGQKGVYEDEAGNKFWNLRIPKRANTDTPEFKDYDLKYALPIFAAGIGCTGWDWQAKVSRWVGFDFDAITGHAAGVGIAGDELDRVKAAACALPWVEVRKSTGGNGLHPYVLLDAIPTANHTEHAALARCILGMMATESNFDFASRIDACGGNMWIWHRKMRSQNHGLELVKAAECSLNEDSLPINWRDHIEVVRRKRSKVFVQGIEDGNDFDKLAAAQQCVTLDSDHKRILDELRRMPFVCEWVTDHNCCRIHTKALAELGERIKIRGVYQTNSEGRDPNTANGFMFPLPEGSWRVFRFSPGISEAPTWNQDGQGWTTCLFNTAPDLRTAARALGGKFDGEKDGYYFDTAASAVEAIKMLGGRVSLPEEMNAQDAFVKIDKTGHVSIDVAAKDGYSGDMRNWIERKKQKRWLLTTDVVIKEQPSNVAGPIDGLVRITKTPSKEQSGWLVKQVGGEWYWSNKDNAKSALVRLGNKKNDLDFLLGEAVLNPWTLVNLPFQQDYPGNRQINFNAPQYRFMPAETEEEDHPHWDMILKHCFQDLDPVLPRNEWARQNNVASGRDYGLLWIACMLREPFSPLPYLFLFGDQNCGKSILWESMRLLVTSGVVSADKAFKSANDFNGELANAVLAYVEETDLSTTASAYNRLKSWVTSPTISIRKMRTDAYEQPNTLHFIQTANERSYCPVFPNDTRIVMLYVPKLTKEIPKSVLVQRLEEEAPYFMRTVLNMQLPSVEGRLRIPVVETESKKRSEDEARSDLETFLQENCVESSESIKFSEFFARFKEWLPEAIRSEWSKKRVAMKLPERFSTKRLDGKETYITNIQWIAT